MMIVEKCIDRAHQLQTSTQAARVNLAALGGPVPNFDSHQPQLIPDDVQWEIMSGSGSTGTAVDPHARVAGWAKAVGEEQLEDVQSNLKGFTNTRKADILDFDRRQY
jgi:hypothetical protein